MEFCQKCDNMYYMKVNDDRKLIHFCKYCGYEDNELINVQNLKVFEFSKENTNKNVHINKYTKYDPTLPHVHTIKCPNMECPCNDSSNDFENDIIYLRYDDKNMKYMYLCCHCDFTWVP
jgi:DNA-directed RNA polymerase subunit M/transcription elongation factor TFIIS